MTSSTPIGTPVKGGAEVPEPVDVDALEREWHEAGESPSPLRVVLAGDALLTALRQQQVEIKAEQTGKDMLEIEYKKVRGELARLRAVIEEAPHDDWCEAYIDYTKDMAGVDSPHCTCWKRKALESES